MQSSALPGPALGRSASLAGVSGSASVRGEPRLKAGPAPWKGSLPAAPPLLLRAQAELHHGGPPALLRRQGVAPSSAHLEALL